MSRWILVSLVAVALAAAPAAAQRQLLPELPSPIVSLTVGPDHGSNCLTVYLNENDLNPDCCYVPLAPGTELADDLHTRATGDWPLCAFDIGYQMVLDETVDATVTFYRGNPTDNPPGAVIAGPFLLEDLPGNGRYLIHHEVTSGIVGPDVWMGVAFSSDGAGLLTSNPAAIGFSHDRDYLGGVSDSPYGGNPVANYFLGVYAQGPTGTESSTWGKVKSIYR